MESLSFGARLKAARNSAGLTQLELASKIGATPSTISKWERDIVAPQLRYMRKLRARLPSLMVPSSTEAA